MLIAKVAVPRRLHGVARERLSLQLHTTRARVVWMGAPPGAGKTTLAAMHIGSLGATRRTAWLQVDGEDADPTALFQNLRLAALAACGRRKVALPVADPAQHIDDRTFARRFARQLFIALGDGGSLVLDNLQEISGVGAENLIAALAEEVPEGSRLLLLSHLPPPAVLAPFAARRHVLVLDAEDLRLDSGETRSLHASLGARGGWTPEQLHALSQGWAAGVVLLANAPAPRASTDERVVDASVRGAAMLFDYFAGVVVGALSPRCVEILRVAALLQAPRPDAINAVTGGTDAERWLEHVRARGLFLDRRDAPGEHATWSMHRLLKVFLREEAERDLPAAAWLNLKQAVARQEAADGQIENAISLWCDVGLHAEAEKALLHAAPALARGGRLKLIIDLSDLLGAERVGRSAWLSYWRGLALVHGDERLALTALECAHRLHEAAGDPLGQLLASAAICEFTVQHFSQFHGFEAWRDRMESLYHPALPFADAEQELRALTGLLAAGLMLEPDSRRLESVVARCEQLLRIEGIDPNQRVAAATLMITAFDQFPGQEARARAFIQLVTAAAQSPGVSELRRASWLCWLSAFHLQAYKFHLRGPDALKACRRSLEELKIIAEVNGFTEARFIHEWLSADLDMFAGDLASAEQRLRLAEMHLRPGRPVLAVHYHMTRAMLTMRLGKIRQARDLALQGVAIAMHAGVPETVVSEVRYTVAQLRLPMGEYSESMAEVRQVIAVARPAYVKVYEAGLQGIAALEKLSLGKDPSAELTAYFGWMRENDRPHVLQLVPGEVAKLCVAALRRGIEVAQVCAVARARSLSAPADAPANWPWRVALRTLGGFELHLDGEPWRPAGKPQRKPLDLIKALAARDREAFVGVNAQQLAEELWPDLELEDIRANLHTTLHRARKLLGSDAALLHADGQLSFDRGLVWCDTAALRACTDRMLASPASGDDDESAPHTGAHMDPSTIRQLASEINALARGPFLPGEEPAWAAFARERCNAMLVTAVKRCAASLSRIGAQDEALALYERGLADNPLIEAFYRAQMRIHLARGEPSAALVTYRRCREALSVVLGVAPSAETERLYRQALRPS
ncbi:MAG: hypothetical protein JNM76_02485 [Betaproteobacteria bacterium]|nr:hypothetical protein [Betaproteobacteria bacterium]